MHVVFLSWRDTSNPEAGGAELYLGQIAKGLVERGTKVTIFSAAHDQAPGDETRDGITFRRRGSKLSVYAQGIWSLVSRRFGPVDVVVDIQNGLPFFSRAFTRVPVVVLVHHVHREQWPVVYPGPVGRLGWWIERRLAPRLYARCRYVAVSSATRDELVDLGVSRERVTVVHNGTLPPLAVPTGRSNVPTICVVGRLVPHKQVEHAIDAWAELRTNIPDLRLIVVGDGWWSEQLHDYARGIDGGERIEFTGQVTEERKQEIYAAAWVLALPSLKEGWGLVVGEAGSHSTPCVAYTSAGGTQESVEHEVSGLLVADRREFTDALGRILTDPELRDTLSTGALKVSHRFTWQAAQASFAEVLGSPTPHAQDPDHLG